MRLRKLTIPVVAVALGMTACGDDSSSGDETSDNGGETAEESSGDDSGESSEGDDSESDDEAADDESGSGGGEVDGVALFESMAGAYTEAGSFEFESTVTESGQEVTIDGAIETGSDGGYTAMRMVVNQAGEEVTMLLVDDQFYMEMSESMGMPGGGEGWLTFGTEGDSQVSEEMAGAFEEIGSAADLSARLAENPDAVTVTEVGSATVEGVETTEYEVVVNDIAAYTDSEANTGISEMSYTMWIDGDNLPRRMIQETDVSGPVEMVYKNFGVDVDIEAPPEDEVTDMSEMMNNQQ